MADGTGAGEEDTDARSSTDGERPATDDRTATANAQSTTATDRTTAASADTRERATVSVGGRSVSLEAWTVATANLALFGLALVVAGHASGVLSDLLGGLGTLPGLAAFAYLWALLVEAIRWALATGGLDSIRDGEFRSLLARGVVAGSGVGVTFLLGVVAVVAAVGFLRSGSANLVAFLFVLAVGAAVAVVVGAVVGLLAALVNVILYRASDLLVAPEDDNGRFSQ
jgi:hypothetical protein